MDSTSNQLSNSLSDSLSNSLSDSFTNLTNTDNSTTSWGWWTILGVVLFVILILAIGGLNIFTYLATGTQQTANWFQSLADFVKEYTGQINLSSGLGNVVGVSAIGTRDIIDAASKDVNYVSTAIDQGAERVLNPIIQKTTQLGGTSISSSTPTPTNNTENNALNRALNRQQAMEEGAGGPKGTNYNADDSLSSIQKTGGKAGWCFIGDDNGTRTCARVGENQMCMSGDIFPTSEICVNPSLRA